MGTPVYGSERLRARDAKGHFQKKGTVVVLEERFAGVKTTDVRVGSCASLSGGSCCLACRRYLSPRANRKAKKRRPVLDHGCEWCGRVAEIRERPEGIDG